MFVNLMLEAPLDSKRTAFPPAFVMVAAVERPVAHGWLPEDDPLLAGDRRVAAEGQVPTVTPWAATFGASDV